MIVSDGVRAADARAAALMAKGRLLDWHDLFSRFQPDSEISRLNADLRPVVPVSPLLRRVIETGVQAAHDTGGLVDPTLLSEIEQAGYVTHFTGTELPLRAALELAPPRAPARSSPASLWRQVSVDRRAGVIERPPGVTLDAGGIAKGVFADELGTMLGGFDAFVVDCAGDLRLGGSAHLSREVEVASPFDDSIILTLTESAGGIATSGIGRRSWLAPGGRPAHHLLDPRTGRPVFTGVVQVTALAPTAAEAEVLAKAALLSGPQGADGWLAHGGVIVLDDGSYRLLEP